MTKAQVTDEEQSRLVGEARRRARESSLYGRNCDLVQLCLKQTNIHHWRRQIWKLVDADAALQRTDRELAGRRKVARMKRIAFRFLWQERSCHQSPYITVAMLMLPRQNAYSAERQRYFDDVITFPPAHALAAHRPIGSVMRARLRVYEALSRLRHQRNGAPAGTAC